MVDGASLWTTYRKVILPLSRPALAALASLEFTFIYNDFFWALILMKPGASGPSRPPSTTSRARSSPITTCSPRPRFIVAVPTIIVYLVLPKQFVGGLTLGSTKG